MSEDKHQDEAPDLEPQELEEQNGELLPDREALSIVDPLKGPMPMDPGTG